MYRTIAIAKDCKYNQFLFSSCACDMENVAKNLFEVQEDKSYDDKPTHDNHRGV